MIFPYHGCADNNFITFLYKLFMFLYPVYDNSKLIFVNSSFGQKYQKF